MKNKPLNELVIYIKSGGDLATGVAVRLFCAGFKKIVLIETEAPLAVRRTVSFSDAVYNKSHTVEGITSRLCQNTDDIAVAHEAGEIPILVDPKWKMLQEIKPDVVIDAILAKKNLGTHIEEAPLVIGFGPGFTASEDVDCIIETNRGHFLGTVIYKGSAQDNTGVPGIIQGFGIERVLWTPVDGIFNTQYDIGDLVDEGDVICKVGETEIKSKLKGVIRGLLRSDLNIKKGTKVADVDPRGDASYCNYVSEKSRAIGGGVLEAILNKYNFIVNNT